MVDWKKEISFGRKPKETTDEQRAGGDAPAVESSAAEEQVPFWKKEITFGRKKETAPAPAEPLEDETPAAVELLEAYVGPTAPSAAELLDRITASPAEPEPAQPQAPSFAEAGAVTYPVAVPDPEPVADVVDLLAPVQPEAPAPDVPAVPAPAVPAPATPAASIDLSFAAPPPPPAVEEPVPVPTTVTAASPPPSTAEPAVVHPPVPAAQLPPLDTDEKKRKKKKEKAPKADGESVPFWKRDLGGGRKKKDKPSVENAASEPAATDAVRAEEKEKKEKRPRPSLSFSLPRLEARAKKGGKLPKRVVGLKIGASQLAAATVANNGHAEVLQVARTPLDPGVVANGELRDPERLAEALKEFFTEHKLPRRGVRLGIATNRIGVRTLEIAGITDAKQLQNAIRFRAQEALPIPIDEAVLDYQVLSETTNDEGETVRKILLVLAYRDLIDRYVAACRKAGVQLVGIDLEAFALLRALAAPRQEGESAAAALVAVTVGHDRTTFAVSDGRVCEFTRVLDWGGHSLNVAIARALDLAPSEADDVKRQLSLDGNGVPQGLTPEAAQKARDAARQQVQAFARELVSSLQFYQNQPGSLGIGEIVLTGGTAHFGGLADELQRLIGVRVRIADPLVRVKVGKKLREPEQLGSLAVAIGLGIED